MINIGNTIEKKANSPFSYLASCEINATNDKFGGLWSRECYTVGPSKPHLGHMRRL